MECAIIFTFFLPPLLLNPAGQWLDSQQLGKEPEQWSIQVSRPAMFVEGERKVEVPHTASQDTCHDCHGATQCLCWKCQVRLLWDAHMYIHLWLCMHKRKSLGTQLVWCNRLSRQLSMVNPQWNPLIQTPSIHCEDTPHTTVTGCLGFNVSSRDVRVVAVCSVFHVMGMVWYPMPQPTSPPHNVVTVLLIRSHADCARDLGQRGGVTW